MRCERLKHLKQQWKENPRSLAATTAYINGLEYEIKELEEKMMYVYDYSKCASGLNKESEGVMTYNDQLKCCGNCGYFIGPLQGDGWCDYHETSKLSDSVCRCWNEGDGIIQESEDDG